MGRSDHHVHPLDRRFAKRITMEFEADEESHGVNIGKAWEARDGEKNSGAISNHRSSWSSKIPPFTKNLFLGTGIGFPGSFNDGELDVYSEEEIETLKEILPSIVEEEFPLLTDEQIPSGRDVINIGSIDPNRPLYSPGNWVEIEGSDMIWRLDMITRVLKKAPDDWDWNDPNNFEKEPKWTFTYNAGDRRDIAEEDLRSPEQGLQLIFGHRPWVWQQWAVLKLENKIRFQEGHENDVKKMDIQKFATVLWDQWLNHPSNSGFKKLFNDERIGEYGRNELVDHIQKPFHLIDIITEDNDEWDFEEDEDIGVYTYSSFLGVFYFIPVLAFILQLALPCILVLSVYSRTDYEECKKLDLEKKYAKVLTIFIYAYYLTTTVPEAYYNLHNVVGNADTTYSRLNSLRRNLWMKGGDTLIQQCFYKLDTHMNTGYIVFLAMLNIYVLAKEGNPIDVVLNSLAFFFIARIDEDLCRTQWWDPKSRWISAGAVEVVIQNTLNVPCLSSHEKFSKYFRIPLDDLWEACGNEEVFDDNNLVPNRWVAKRDMLDISYMTRHDQMLHLCGNIAEEQKNENALREYRSPRVDYNFS
mmetsp:Transcript_25912/g.59668  ORF Transcript_25912/g.59668 Transcript_25912/m.59668 type:complete len:584 (-) Transcript_25912:54-1805(-)